MTRQQLDQNISALEQRLALLKSWRANFETHQQQSQACAENIIRACAAVWKLSVEELASRDRHQPVVDARFAAMFLVRHSTPFTLPTIGALFNRDHTGVLYGCRQADNWQRTRVDFSSRLELVKSHLKL